MKKAVYALLYVSLAGFILTSVMNILHRPDVAVVFLIVSFFILYAAVLLAAMFPSHASNNGNGKNTAGKWVAALFAAACVAAGLLAKRNHFPGAEVLIVMGLGAYLLYFFIGLA